MSVKGKIKRLNRKVDYLNDKIKRLEHEMSVNQMHHEDEKQMLENLIKFFVVNQVGEPAEDGVHIDREYVDKLDSINVKVFYESENKAFVIQLKEDK